MALVEEMHLLVGKLEEDQSDLFFTLIVEKRALFIEITEAFFEEVLARHCFVIRMDWTESINAI